MTPRQIRNLLVQNGFVEAELACVEFSKDEVEVYVTEDDGTTDYDATEALSDRVGKVLGWGGFRCGYGAWVLSSSYRASGTDYCDPSNPCHY